MTPTVTVCSDFSSTVSGVVVVSEGRRISCYTYVVNKDGDHYTGEITDEEKARQGAALSEHIPLV